MKKWGDVRKYMIPIFFLLISIISYFCTNDKQEKQMAKQGIEHSLKYLTSDQVYDELSIVFDEL